MKSVFVSIILSSLLAVTGSVTADQNWSSTMQITPGAEILTMINVLTPAPEHKTKTANLLQQGIDKEISKQDGFVAATVHESLDSNHIVVYAQWRDQDVLMAAAKKVKGGEAPLMAEAYSLGNPDYHPYAVKATITKKD